MRYVVLSFDDGRKDFYTNAVPILKKYRLPTTLNIVSDFIGKQDLSQFASANYECMSADEILTCQKMGIEIANHSADHTNDVRQIIRGSDKLLCMQCGSGRIGFSSPESEISQKNIFSYEYLIRDHIVSYIRSGNQVRRDGLLYACMYFLYKTTKSKILFWIYNRRNLIELKEKRPRLYPSVTCNADNSAEQMLFFIKSIPDNYAVIIMFHSILSYGDTGWAKDKWYNSTEDFEKLCCYLSKKRDIRVITNRKLHDMIPGEDDE